MDSTTATTPLATVLALVSITINTTTAGTEVAVFIGQSSPAETVPIDAIDHHQWNDLLSRYVDRDGDVAYARWHASSEDRQKLAGYLDKLSSVDLDAPSAQSEKLAFWINTYNAVTISGVLHHYPITSIRDIASEAGGFNIWDDYRLYVDRKPYSLNQIEHDVLRKMNDPRMHFAINCASKSCPALSREAYTSERLDAQLTQGARRFFANPANLSQDNGAIRVSSLIDWYGEDFGDTDTEVLARLRPWLPIKPRPSANHDEAPLRYLDYDWSLNAAGISADDTKGQLDLNERAMSHEH